MICVFGHRAATESDRVIRRLRAVGREVVRVNTGEGEALAAAGSGRSAYAEVVCDGRRVDSREVAAAWCHQLPPLRQQPHPPLPAEACLSSRLYLWDAVFRSVPARRWLNAPWRVREASNKHEQLVAAAGAGLPVVPTVVGDLPAAVRALGPVQLVAKYLGDSARLWAEGQGMASLTVPVQAPEADDALPVPLLWQQRVEAVREYRVVVVGGEAFAGAAEKPRGVTDIRDVPGLPPYRPADLPPDLLASLLAMLGALGLGYCSADLAVDHGGRWTFLDLNATGAFWWVDDLYDRAITESLAQLLANRADAEGCSDAHASPNPVAGG